MFVTTIFKSTSYTNDINQTIHKVFTFEPLSYTSFTLAVMFNRDSQFGFMDTPSYLRDQNITKAIYDSYRDTAFLGSSSGFIGRNPIVAVPYPKIVKIS